MCFKWLFGRKNKPVGKVIHFFDKIMVAVVVLESALKVGDKIKIVRGDESFEETIESMQIDHQNCVSASRGQEVAIKFSRPTKDGALIYKV